MMNSNGGSTIKTEIEICIILRQTESKDRVVSGKKVNKHE